MAKSISNASGTFWTVARSLPLILVVAGVFGLVSSFVLTMEKMDVVKNPDYAGVCDLNPVISCSTVTKTRQAEVFGFPNPFIGLVGYSALLTIGLALLAGAKFRRWFWLLTEAGLVLAIAFITWLQYQTFANIKALCLFCMLAWVVTAPAFWYTTLHNLREGYLKLPARLAGVSVFAQKHHLDILIVWYLAIALLILTKFWYYWSTLL